MKLKWIYGRQKRKEGKLREEEEERMRNAAVGMGSGEGGHGRTTSQLVYGLHNGGERKRSVVGDMV